MHLIDFDENIYGEEIKVSFVTKIRNLIYGYGRFNSMITELPESIKSVLDQMGNFSELTSELDRALKDVDDLPSFTRDGGFIKKGYCAALDELWNIKNNHVDIMAQMEASYAEILNAPKVSIKYNNMIGYYLEVPNPL